MSFLVSRASEDPDELEEERRLAYVGITRAEKILYLTNANSRLLFRAYKLQSSNPFYQRD